jgi:UDP:flavonoid glycosyltransferase YjiC (YdhE family)
VRVLFSSTSGHGHVIPMLQLASAFRDAGHDVLWATSAQATPLVRTTGIEVVAAGAHGSEEAALRGAVLSRAAELPGDQRAPFVFPRMFGEALAPRMADDLLPLVQDWKPNLLVHEHAELAAPLAGAVHGVPCVTHSFGTAVPAVILADTRSRLAGLWEVHGLEVPPYAGCFGAGYLDICPPSVQSTSVSHVPDVLALRPITVSPGPVSELAPDEPLVYVTLGTIHNDPRVLREVLTGIVGLPVRVLVAVGPRGDPASLGEQPAHVRVETWVDQAAVLRECSAVISHGGSGTFLGALAHARPQLCLPQAADQFRNAEGGTRAGAALALGPAELTAATVRTAGEQLLVDEGLRSGASAVAGEIASMPSPSTVASRLAERHG